jgi:hypothetical protein
MVLGIQCNAWPQLKHEALALYVEHSCLTSFHMSPGAFWAITFIPAINPNEKKSFLIDFRVGYHSE